MMTTATWLQRMLDTSWLSSQLGGSVRANRVRVKPETSISVAVEDEQGLCVGWARLLWPDGHRKATKAKRNAAEAGLEISQRLVGDMLLQSGLVSADPKLVRPLQNATEAGIIGAWQLEQVLRYNPMRRLVLREGERIVRIAAADRPLSLRLDHLISAEIPIPQRLDDGSLPGISVQAFTGNGDLAGTPDLEATATVGRIIAHLHATESIPRELRTDLLRRAPDPVAQARTHVRLLEVLSPGLARRARAIASKLSDKPAVAPVLSHGDLSPDQVLVGDKQVWLTDFDRACLASRATDLGSFLAVVDEETGEVFLDGYRSGGGQLPSAKALRDAVTGSLMLRAVDPLRLASPAWELEVAANLDRIAELLT